MELLLLGLQLVSKAGLVNGGGLASGTLLYALCLCLNEKQRIYVGVVSHLNRLFVCKKLQLETKEPVLLSQLL